MIKHCYTAMNDVGRAHFKMSSAYVYYGDGNLSISEKIGIIDFLPNAVKTLSTVFSGFYFHILIYLHISDI